MKPQRNITIVDVAETAGVAVATVSRVLNRGTSVRPATAEAVRKAAASLGYQLPQNRRGPRGRRGPAQKTNIALIVVERRGLRWILDCAPVYSYVLHGAQTAVAERGCNLTIHQAQSWDRLEEAVQRSEAQGIILFGSSPAGPMPARVRRMPLVWVMGGALERPGDNVLPDRGRCGVLAATWALEKGHRHCAAIGTSMATDDPNPMPGRAFCWRMEQSGGTAARLFSPDLAISTPELNVPNEPVLARLIDELAALSPRPTVLLSQADMFTPSIYRLLQERGITPQRDITVITINNERPYLAALHPKPVIIDLQAETIGRRAIDQLFWRIQHRAEPAMRIMVEPILVDNNDVPPAGP